MPGTAGNVLHENEETSREEKLNDKLTFPVNIDLQLKN